MISMLQTTTNSKIKYSDEISYRKIAEIFDKDRAKDMWQKYNSIKDSEVKERYLQLVISVLPSNKEFKRLISKEFVKYLNVINKEEALEFLEYYEKIKLANRELRKAGCRC